METAISRADVAQSAVSARINGHHDLADALERLALEMVSLELVREQEDIYVLPEPTDTELEPLELPCAACNAEPDEDCRPGCIGCADLLDAHA